MENKLDIVVRTLYTVLTDVRDHNLSQNKPDVVIEEIITNALCALEVINND